MSLEPHDRPAPPAQAALASGSPVGGIWRKATLLLHVYYINMLQYRAELLLWALSGSMPFIMMGIWMQAADSGRFHSTPVGFARYFLAVFLIRQLTAVWVIHTFEEDMVAGKLSPQLLAPLDPAWRYLASHVSERGARLPFVFVILLLFFLAYPASFWIPSLGDFLLSMLLAQLGFLLRFIIQYTLALCAFWTERAMAIEEFYFLFFTLLSGVIAPLDTFPAPLREFALWTPFPYTIHLPVTVLLGETAGVGRGMGVMMLWMVLFFGLNRWLWRRGLKRYSGMGA